MKKILTVILLITSLTAILMFACGVWAAYASAENAVSQSLRQETLLVANLLNDTGDFQRFAESDERITVIDQNGEVLFDTECSDDNHSDREEVQAAFADNPKIVKRYSQTVGSDMYYYAVKTQMSGQTVVVRLAVKSASVNEYLKVSIPVFALVLLIVWALSFAAGKYVANKFAARMKEINKSLKSVADGSYVPVKVDSRDADFYYVINSINDLGEGISRHIANEAAERRKLGVVLDSVSQGIIALNDKKQTVFINKSAMSFFGDGTTSDADKKDLIYFVDDLEIYRKISDLIGSAGSFECTLGERDVAVSVTRVGDGPDEVSAIVVLSDISVAKRVAREKSDFFANASHELKTPVTVIRGLSEILLAKGDLDEFSTKKLETLYKETLRLGSIVADMMELSDLEHSQGAANIEDVDLRAVAEEVRDELAESSRAKNLTFCVEGSGIARISKKHAFELVENLCSNAVNYNRENGTVNVNIVETPDGATLMVTDSGIGIPKEHIPRLCERFYRVDKSRSKKTGGTGLGLAIVKHICIANNAKLQIESVFGEGTVVTVEFPRVSGVAENENSEST